MLHLAQLNQYLASVKFACFNAFCVDNTGPIPISSGETPATA